MYNKSGKKQELKSFNNEIVCFNDYLRNKGLDKLVEKRLYSFTYFKEFRKISKFLLFKFGYFSEYLVKLFIIIDKLNSSNVMERFKHEFHEFNNICLEIIDDKVFDYDLMQIQNGNYVYLCKLIIIRDVILYWYSRDVEAIFDYKGNLVCTANSINVLLYKLIVKKFY